MKRVLASYGVAYWTLAGDLGLSRSRSCEVIHTEGGILHASGCRSVGGAQRGRGQHISCHTCTRVLDFCETIFGFPGDSSCPAFGPDCLLGPKTQEKHVKISKMVPQNQRECITIPRGQTCVSFHFIR